MEKVEEALALKRELFPTWFPLPFCEKHREMESFFRDSPAGSFSLIVAPRGHGKTSFLTVAEVLLQALSPGGARYVVVGGQTAERARGVLWNLRVELEENPRLRARFRFSIKKPWNASSLTLKVHRPFRSGQERRRERRNPRERGGGRTVRIAALGLRQNWRGLLARGERPDLIILDDVEKSENVRNPRLVNERVESVFRDIFPALAPNGRLFWLGNLFSRRAALTRLFEGGENFPLVRRFRFDSEDSSGNSVWPARFPKEKLEELRRFLGSARYAAEYLNVPSDEGVFVRPEDVRYYDEAETRGKALDVAGFYDPSATSTEESDYQAFVTLGKWSDEEGGVVYYVLDAFLKKCRLDDAVASICARAKERLYAFLGVETNVLGEWVAREFARASARFGAAIPWRGVNHSGKEKRGRILSLAPLIERGAIRFLRNQTEQRLLIEQIVHYGAPGGHDDGPDALAGCLALYEAPKKAVPAIHFTYARGGARAP